MLWNMHTFATGAVAPAVVWTGQAFAVLVVADPPAGELRGTVLAAVFLCVHHAFRVAPDHDVDSEIPETDRLVSHVFRGHDGVPIALQYWLASLKHGDSFLDTRIEGQNRTNTAAR